MKGNAWKLAKSITWGLILVTLIALYLWFVYGEVRDRSHLREYGVTVEGALQMATAHRTNFIPTGYSFTVQYLGQNKKFYVSRDLFLRYVHNERFAQNAPIKIVYLPNNETAAIPSEMLNVWIYWGSIFYFVGFAGILGYAFVYCKKTINAFRQPQAALRAGDVSGKEPRFP